MRESERERVKTSTSFFLSAFKKDVGTSVAATTEDYLWEDRTAKPCISESPRVLSGNSDHNHHMNVETLRFRAGEKK